METASWPKIRERTKQVKDRTYSYWTIARQLRRSFLNESQVAGRQERGLGLVRLFWRAGFFVLVGFEAAGKNSMPPR